MLIIHINTESGTYMETYEDGSEPYFLQSANPQNPTDLIEFTQDRVECLIADCVDCQINIVFGEIPLDF